MAQSLVFKTRVKQTSNSTGTTGNLTFATTVSGFRAFSADIADGVPFPYVAKGATASEWEEGIGELASGGTQLVRRVTASSNGNDLVSFTTGPIEIVLSRHAAIIGNECIWGTGEDGALTVTGSDVNLTEDKHYTSITWSGAGKINANGFQVFCIGEANFTSAPAGGLNNDANGITGGGWGTLGGGGDGQPTAPANQQAVPSAILGGYAGDPDTGDGDETRTPKVIGHLPPFLKTTAMMAGTGALAEGSGSPGGGAGVAQLNARRIRRTSGTGTGAIRANGAAGTTDNPGGGGGRVRVLYDELLGSTKTGMLQANGGDGIGTSNDGGNGGFIEAYNIRTGVSASTAGSTTTTGTAGTCSQDL
jgi:hypothetical protein